MLLETYYPGLQPGSTSSVVALIDPCDNTLWDQNTITILFIADSFMLLGFLNSYLILPIVFKVIEKYVDEA